MVSKTKSSWNGLKRISTMPFEEYLKLRKLAFNLVAKKSDGEMRHFSPIKNQPYWTHLMNVHNYLVIKELEDYEILLAAILHDIVEDSDVSIADITQNFNTRIATIVEAVTKKENYTPKDFYTNILNNSDLGPCYIKVSDRIDNILTNYCYSYEKCQYYDQIEETRHWFIPMAERVGLVDDLISAINYYSKHSNF